MANYPCYPFLSGGLILYLISFSQMLSDHGQTVEAPHSAESFVSLELYIFTALGFCKYRMQSTRYEGVRGITQR